MSTTRRIRIAATFAWAFAVGCAASPGASTSAASDTGAGQGVCDSSAAVGLCVAYPGDTAAQRSVCATARGTYRVPSVCLPASRVGTCACADVGQGLGAATLSLYAPTYTCASAKAACAQACDGAPGTFNGGC
jgi:hypothetical protein